MLLMILLQKLITNHLYSLSCGTAREQQKTVFFGTDLGRGCDVLSFSVLYRYVALLSHVEPCTVHLRLTHKLAYCQFHDLCRPEAGRNRRWKWPGRLIKKHKIKNKAMRIWRKQRKL